MARFSHMLGAGVLRDVDVHQGQALDGPPVDAGTRNVGEGRREDQLRR